MTEEEEAELKRIAENLFYAKGAEKEAKVEASKIRDEFLRLYDADVASSAYALPVITIEVPDIFFELSQMSKEDFISTRFPDWQIEHSEAKPFANCTVFVLRKNPTYLPGSIDVEIEIDGKSEFIRVAKEVSEYTPEMDWESLEFERPDLYEKLAVPVTKYEMNETAFEKLLAERPEELAVIRRHMKVRKPTIRTTARKVKDGKD